MCALVGSGTTASFVTFSSGTKREKTVAKKRWYPKYGYKWIVPREAGELLVFPYPEGGSQPYFFLWWLKDYYFGKNDGTRQYFYWVENINKKGHEITFTFKGRSKGQEGDKKLNSWNPDLEKLNGKPLETSCKMEGKDLSCLSGSYRATKLDGHKFWF